MPVSRGQAEIDHQNASSGRRQNAQNGQPSPTNSVARGSCAETSFERKQKPSMSHHQMKNLAQQNNNAPRHFCDNKRTRRSARVWLDEPSVKELQDDPHSHCPQRKLRVQTAWCSIVLHLADNGIHVTFRHEDFVLVLGQKRAAPQAVSLFR